MKLTGLRLHGFKSFVEPADIPIEPGITGIIGPNGCGKSNLIEALRFVMGESSYKAMRGDGMYDYMNGVGAHEVIIESGAHKVSLTELESRLVREVVWMYRDRLLDLKRDRRLVHRIVAGVGDDL